MKYLLCLVIAMIPVVSIGCKKKSVESPDQGTGTLVFTANGEDFVRQGFTSKDGWKISFDKVHIYVGGISAYQTKKSIKELDYTLSEEAVGAHPLFSGWIDLTSDREKPMVVEEVKDAPAGIYNCLIFTFKKAKAPPHQGVSLILEGRAVKGEKSLDFSIHFDHEVQFIGGAYVGDEIKGVLKKDGKAEVEMTFHFDHLFGDATVEADKGVNKGALGFGPFARLAAKGKVQLTSKEVRKDFSQENYRKLTKIFRSLGHVGEGHCKSVVLSEKGEK